MQPTQQQGRRIPSLSSVRTLLIRRFLVSSCLALFTQHIHSLRARGVISSHLASATLSEVKVFRKSAGTLCTTPVSIRLLVINIFYTNLSSPNKKILRLRLKKILPFSDEKRGTISDKLIGLLKLNFQNLSFNKSSNCWLSQYNPLTFRVRHFNKSAILQ